LITSQDAQKRRGRFVKKRILYVKEGRCKLKDVEYVTHEKEESR
jgi:hypothetical protein